MNREIRETIDNRRKKLPKDLAEGDQILLRGNQGNALDFDAEGPCLFLRYRDPDRNAIDFYNPRTRNRGIASVSNLVKVTS